MEVFSLVENTNRQVVLKVNADDLLVIAKNPYINKEMAYITITKGSNHTLTVIKKDGTTFSFDWGSSGTTLINDNLNRLKWAAVDYIQDVLHILLDVESCKNPSSVVIYYNDWFKKWQASYSFNDRKLKDVNWWSKTAACKEDMIKELSEVYDLSDFIHRLAPTGIDTWVATIR